MINRYTYAPIGRTPHMEPMGAGEWVKWEDHAAQLEAANQRHAAALEAVARARDDVLMEAAGVCRETDFNLPEEVAAWRYAKHRILALRTKPPEPAQVTVQETLELPEVRALVEEAKNANVSLFEAEDKFHVLSFHLSDEASLKCAKERVEWMRKSGDTLRTALAPFAETKS